MTAVAPEPEAYDIERGPEPATPVGDEGTPRYTRPRGRGPRGSSHPGSAPSSVFGALRRRGPRDARIWRRHERRQPTSCGDKREPCRGRTPPGSCPHVPPPARLRARGIWSRSAERLAPRPSPNSLSESAPLERVPAATVLSPSTTRKYKHRASIGHDARVMTERGIRVQNAVGRPKVKSLFHAMAGVRRFGDDGGEMHPKLVAVDVDAYGEEWTPREQRMVALYFLHTRSRGSALTFADPDSWLRKRMKTEKALSQYAEVQSRSCATRTFAPRRPRTSTRRFGPNS